MASVKNIGINNDNNKDENEKIPSSTMSAETCSNSLNKTPPRESYWFAHGGIEEISPKIAQCASKPTEKEMQLQKDKEKRIHMFREQQEEERLKRLRDLEQQFMQAKKHREVQEEERKRRIEEARIREMERRQQVEERKRQIWEAEQERKEAILRRNMEREARIEARRNAQRNSQCFAFGSSTPRTFDLDLAAIGIGRNLNQGSVLMSSVSGRRSEERELGPPRATSACSLDRKFGDDCMSRSMVSLSSAAFRGRKRTDIMPTLTRERSITPHVTPRGKDTSRSPSRPQSSMSGASEISATSSSVSAVNMRPRPAPRRPRPYSIAGSIVDRSSSVTTNTVKTETERQPRVPERNIASAGSKLQRAKSVGQDKDESEKPKPLSAPKKPVPPPKSSEVLARAKSHPVPIKDNLRKPVKSNMVSDHSVHIAMKKHPDEKQKSVTKEAELVTVNTEKINTKSETVIKHAEIMANSPLTSPTTDSEINLSSDDSKVSAVTESDMNTFTQSLTESEYKEEVKTSEVSKSVNVPQERQNGFHKVKEKTDDIPNENELKEDNDNAQVDLTQPNSVETENGPVKDATPSKPRITSEEEAKAALAEKRRLAREQAEREAELERQRQEEIRRKEEEQRRLEELEQKRLEEEQIRLAELHRQLEEDKLQKAIEEQKQREKEEQERREEEARLKAEKEELERKAREEAEKQRLELEERLKKEEEERAERKRRVEQIMARTRGKGAQNATSPQTETSKFVKSGEITQNSLTPSEESKPNVISQTNISHMSNGCIESKVEKNSVFNSAIENSVSSGNTVPFSDEKRVSNVAPLPDLLNSENIASHSVKNNGHVEIDQFFSTSVSNNLTANRTLSANEITSPTQTNGYSSHEDMSCTTSPEETADTGLLINIESNTQKSSKVTSESSSFTKLVDVETSSFNINNENFLIDVDEVNSNLTTSGNSYVGYDDSLQKKQDAPFADLLS